MAPRVLQLALMPQHWRWATFEKMSLPNCRRYYRIEIKQVANGWSVITYRGPIGKTAQVMVEMGESLEAAEVIAMKRAHKRFLHEYCLTGVGA